MPWSIGQPCPACESVGYPTVEARDSARPGMHGTNALVGMQFMYICANATCRSVLGPTKPAAPAPREPPMGSPSEIPASIVRALHSPASVAPAISAETDYLGVLRARLAWVDAKIEDQTNLRAERTRLRRMLAVAGERPACPARTRENDNQVTILPLLRSATQ